MLQKYPCKILVSKLRAILLLEADFNALHKIIFNQRILPALEQHNFIPMEIVSGRKDQATIHVAINKKLISDIFNQVKTPSAVIITDANNCCHRVSHPFASLTAQHFGVNVDYIMVLLKSIQHVTMFLQTSFGACYPSYSGTSSLPFQNSCKRNDADPVLWLMISVILVRCLYLKGLVSHHVTPISRTIFSLAALL